MAEPAPHFIGWLPMPRAFVRFLLPVAVGAIVGLVVVAAVIAGGQRSPGNGRWEDDHTTTLVGVAYAKPYAMVRVPGDGGSATTILLVEEGKFGAKERVRAFDGRPVRVRGTLLRRDGWQMLELAATDDGLQPTELSDLEFTGLHRPPPRPLGRVTLRGEIVDSKCYLGAMKPGSGLTHRGCALLCLKGGVPPLFVCRTGAERHSVYLLTGASTIVELAGQPVTVEGEAEEMGDITFIRTTRVTIETE